MEEKNKTGTVYFFTGLAGAGKTTIGGLFYRRLRAKKANVFCMDGDAMDGVFKRTGYSTAARLKDAKQQFYLCRALAQQGIDVVMCSISMYDEIRDWNRANIEHYKEIYIKVTQETLYRRDQKQLYSSGAKEVVGVDLPYDEPKTPDVVVENDGQETPEAIVTRLEKQFGLT
ncbi:MAG: adenylyl-sulfate kinase [Oscillospiraceae bacterium]|nr:adenylyl-sulfate kinase [Oscillospiraceae bacterium]